MIKVFSRRNKIRRLGPENSPGFLQNRLYRITLLGFRNRLNVFINWVWNYLTMIGRGVLSWNTSRAEHLPITKLNSISLKIWDKNSELVTEF
jgi:hypothetical protein